MTIRGFAAALFSSAFVLIAVASARVTAAPQAAPVQAAAPDPKADEATFMAVCGACHDANLVEGAFRTPPELDDTISRMQSYGASATADQFEQVRVHLLRTYGRVNVNLVPARDMAPVLDVTSQVADAVVAYRTQNGKFASLDDLKKVPGLDAAKIDARRTRITF